MAFTLVPVDNLEADTGWLILVCGLMGSIIKLIEVTGGAQAFGEWAGRRAKSREATQMWIFIHGCIIFIDDYLNSMTIGSCMKKLTDQHKVSREMLSYITASTAAPRSEKIDLNTGEVEIKGIPRLFTLIIPVVGMVFFTILFDLDMQHGVIATIALCFVLFVGQKRLTAEEFWDYSLEGIKNMILLLVLMVLAYIFAAVNDQVGSTRFIIDVAVEHASPQMLPVLIFLLLAVTEFITGTNWGMYIIALPIVSPICMGADIPVALGCGAVISAGVLGSCCCFYSDCTVITSSATGCDNFTHAWTQMPFGLLAGVVAAIGYLIAGFFMEMSIDETAKVY
ncbi:MAG: hypothetical protein HFE76_13325 [Firmicutes bacterium]|nr:hypothetical protein [Bacillota bacterium]